MAPSDPVLKRRAVVGRPSGTSLVCSRANGKRVREWIRTLFLVTKSIISIRGGVTRQSFRVYFPILFMDLWGESWKWGLDKICYVGGTLRGEPPTRALTTKDTKVHEGRLVPGASGGAGKGFGKRGKGDMDRAIPDERCGPVTTAENI